MAQKEHLPLLLYREKMSGTKSLWHLEDGNRGQEGHLIWALLSEPPVCLGFRIDPGVIELGHSPGFLLAPVRRTCLALEESR